MKTNNNNNNNNKVLKSNTYSNSLNNNQKIKISFIIYLKMSRFQLKMLNNQLKNWKKKANCSDKQLKNKCKQKKMR